ncbi:50S ribosomal protein L13 [Candidatus Curtissbacteria bacterium RIFCSPHIGHO2_01_FULL_41_11]|uniref:Large ribosomal subunit protein uL13 n=1 Tax=Candidatus Curtissbacteria bacterium RIFCSPHIGHO2_01_FULL_41_11 TaxID=1797711 RepID=A0A1F5G3K7_9BACT|nr:MAG: 50S ribosomal protein L13 [Candidatus Curtissbacteria bacterium RIFCSPHIGHO2_01_FULL_41_11]
MKNIKPKDITRKWHLIDAKDEVLGRLSTKIATILMGKNKPYYTPHLDCGDNIVVINTSKIKLSGKKENQKIYYHHSGYPGGLKSKTAAEVRKQKPQELLRHSVVGMLPKNKIGKEMMRKLFIYPEKEHAYKDKFKQ